ncbi:Crp/Fnr family transcriptional regulator [Persicitalea sp.]|uniref:Crp/Fnr family transcriptional regulator n=1 Tax=Persicitalea sp. TaxID=3100273 RepID=UPI0035942599
MTKIDTETLRQQITAAYPLEPEELDAFVSVWTPITACRKEVLTQAGDTEKYLYFIQEGLQRIYYLDAQGREATLMFSYTHSFGGVIDSFFTQQPSRYFYETLMPSVLLKMSYTDYERLSLRHPALVRMVLSSLSGALSGVLERLVEIQSYTSEEKFRALLRRSPHILQLVPHKYLANYLGINATNFSKLLNRVKI